MKTNAYCPMPFVTLTVNPGGTISRCMMSLENMGPLSAGTYSNEKFQALRQNMLDGKWDEQGCNSCFRAENNGHRSQRLKWLDREEKYLEETGIYNSNLSVIENNIYHLYMNFNNICNFKCRMCGPHFSNAWVPDYKKLTDNNDLSIPKKPLQAKQQVDVDKFFADFGKKLSNLRQIWITGGEPFMDDAIYRFFEKLKDYSDLSKIKVVINTNASKVDVNRLPSLFEVKSLLLNISVDSTGDLYKYMRGYNYSFEELDKKIRQIAKLKHTHSNFEISVNGAYQVYNILDIEKFYDWGAEVTGTPDGTLIEYRVLGGPQWLRARNAPNEIKSQANSMINKLMKRYPSNSYLEDCMKEIKSSRVDNDIEMFLKWNTSLDNIRQEKLIHIFPELMQGYEKNE